jgi:hypothetical protein
MFTIRIENAAEILAKLEALPDKVERKVLKKAVHSGGEIILDEMQSAARTKLACSGTHVRHKGMGELIAKFLKLKPWRRRKKNSYGAGVVIDRAANEHFVHISKTGERSYIPVAIEYGHIAPDGTLVEPIPFVRETVDAFGRSAVTEMIAEIETGVRQEYEGHK